MLSLTMKAITKYLVCLKYTVDRSVAAFHISFAYPKKTHTHFSTARKSPTNCL